jgi:translation initiation factor 6
MLRTNFEGDSNLGLYGLATDKYCAVGLSSAASKAEKELNVKAHVFAVFNTGLVGIFAAGNSSGLVLPDFIETIERDNIDLNAIYIKSRFTALGNLILMNDKGIILSPLLRKEKREIENFFGLRCEATTIAGSFIVGKTGIATNKGCLLHPKVKKHEQELIEEVLDVKSDIGTVNFGSPYTGAGVIANSQSCVVSERSSGPELGRIVEALGFL